MSGHTFHLYLSQMVIDEVRAGDAVASRDRLKTLRGLPLLDITPEVMDLASRLIASGKTPRKAAADAAHIAIAAVDFSGEGRRRLLLRSGARSMIGTEKSGPAVLRLTGLLLMACCFGLADQTGTLGGKAVDSGGAVLPFPRVHVTAQSNAELRYETTGDTLGRFHFARVEPGVYTIRVAVQGFRDKTVSEVLVTSGQQTDLGRVALDFAGCDSPGIICDDFGLSVDNDPVHAQGIIEVPELCAVDIDEGKSSCTIELDVRGTIPPARDPDSDFWIRPGRRGELYIAPRNGARLALNPPTDRSKSGCISALYSTKQVLIDGRPLAAEFAFVRAGVGMPKSPFSI